LKKRPANGVCRLICEDNLSVNQAHQHPSAEAIRTGQCIGHQWLRQWMDGRGSGDHDLHVSCSPLAQEDPVAARLNAQAGQASADRAWLSMARFSTQCREQQPGKQGYPRFQHDTRSVEYKATGWRLEPDGKRITCTDGNGMGTLRMIGKKGKGETSPSKQIKRVRLVKRADGSEVQVAVKTERTVPHEPTGKQVGSDVGLQSCSPDSDGTTGEHPRSLRQAEKPWKRLPRRVSNKHKRAKNRRGAMHRLAKGYLKASRQRKDGAVTAASALVQSHDFLADEDLQITSLVTQQRLAKRLSAARWGLFLSSRPVRGHASYCACRPRLAWVDDARWRLPVASGSSKPGRCVPMCVLPVGWCLIGTSTPR
jgi:putative transposase